MNSLRPLFFYLSFWGIFLPTVSVHSSPTTAPTVTERQKLQQELQVLTQKLKPLRERAEKSAPVSKARADLDTAFRRYYERLRKEMVAVDPKSRKLIEREQKLREILKTSGSRAKVE
jgi:hypothetical protein